MEDKKVLEAMERTPRHKFVPERYISQAYKDHPLPIGYGQTISQPLTVAFMLELLDPRSGQTILDVGAGSGWTTALLAEIAGKAGKVIAVERINELLEWGKKNVDKYGYVGKGMAKFYLADGSQGFPQEAPFDRILVSASSPDIPQSLKDQLKIGGKMVLPVKSSIFYLEKKNEQEFLQEEFPGFSFVPLINEKNNLP